MKKVINVCEDIAAVTTTSGEESPIYLSVARDLFYLFLIRFRG